MFLRYGFVPSASIVSTAMAHATAATTRCGRHAAPARKAHLYVRALAIAGMAAASALAGAASAPIPDPLYGGVGNGVARIAAASVPADSGSAQHAIVQADGRLVLVGTTRTSVGGNDQIQTVLARFDAQGLPDTSFGAQHDGIYRTAFFDGGGIVSGFADVAQAGGGKLMYVGHGSPASMIVGRLDAGGAPDGSFSGSGRRLIGPTALVDGASEGAFTAVLPLTDGKTLLLGFALVASGASSYDLFSCAMRLRTDGSTDSSFGSSGRTCIAPRLTSGATSGVFAGIVLADGDILLAGASQHSGGSAADMSVARLDANGTLDTSFGPDHDGWAFVAFDQGGTLADGAAAITVDAGGRILLAGYFDAAQGTDIGIARLLGDGRPDLSFGTQGRLQVALDPGVFHANQAHSVAVLPDGRILVGAYAHTGGTGVALALEPDGTLDSRFGEGGVYAQAAPGLPGMAKVASHQQVLAGDYLYLVGYNVNGAGHPDLAAARTVMPLFADGFDLP
jgi:uncharacterized delta-60 repeat protein